MGQTFPLGKAYKLEDQQGNFWGYIVGVTHLNGHQYVKVSKEALAAVGGAILPFSERPSLVSNFRNVLDISDQTQHIRELFSRRFVLPPQHLISLQSFKLLFDIKFGVKHHVYALNHGSVFAVIAEHGAGVHSVEGDASGVKLYDRQHLPVNNASVRKVVLRGDTLEGGYPLGSLLFSVPFTFLHPLRGSVALTAEDLEFLLSH